MAHTAHVKRRVITRSLLVRNQIVAIYAPLGPLSMEGRIGDNGLQSGQLVASEVTVARQEGGGRGQSMVIQFGQQHYPLTAASSSLLKATKWSRGEERPLSPSTA